MGIDFLSWLAQRGRRIGECTQHDVDAYFGAGPSTRLHACSFLYWAKNARKVRGFEIPSGTTQSHATFGNNERLQGLRRLLLDDDLDLPWRIAGALVLLFGQPAECIAALTIGQVKIDSDERVLLSPAGDWIVVPDPLATLLRTYLNCRRNMATAANPDSAWLFPGACRVAISTPRMSPTSCELPAFPCWPLAWVPGVSSFERLHPASWRRRLASPRSPP